MPSRNKQRKLCILGDFSVGKSSLVRRYVLDEFSATYQATAGVKIYQNQSTIMIDGDSVDVDHSIWDVEGSRFGEQLLRSYIMGASGALVVGDVTREDALASMTGHAEKFLETRPGRPLVFALNKTDLVLPEDRCDPASLSREFGTHVLQTSALTGHEVPAAFHAMFRRIFEIGA